jgi:xylulokinase
MTDVLPLIVSLEVGSSSIRAAFVDTKGRVVASSQRPIDTHIGEDGSVLQDPGYIWEAVKMCVADSFKSGKVKADNIQAFICSGEYGSIIPVAENGEPAGSLYLYSDLRGSAHTRDIYEQHPEAYQLLCDLHGRLFSGNGEDPLSSMLFIRDSQPEIWEKTFCFLEPMDYIQARLTGCCVANQGTNHSWMMIDNREFNCSRYHPDLLALTGLDGEKLPALVPMGSIVGTVLPEVAAELGLNPGTKVIAGANDTQAMAIGTGAERGEVGFSIGTTASPSVFSNRIDPETGNLIPFDPDGGVLTMIAPIQSDSGFHLANAEIGYGGKALECVLKNLIFADDHLGNHSQTDMFSSVDLAAGNVAPGANGLLFFPWLEGSWQPRFDGNARGGFINMTLQTTREEMVRAVLEGIAYQLRWIYPAIREFSGRDLNTICFGGGGARSDVWAQIIADIVGVPVRQLERPELANCRGAAMLAFHNLGLIDLNTITDWKRVKTIYQPRPQYQKQYQILGDAFIKAHEQLQPVYQALAMW